MNTKQNISKKHKILIIVILSFLAIVYWVIFDFLRQIEFDTASFVGASRYMFNLEGGYNFQSRLSKPLVLILPGLVEWLSGIHPKFVFLIQNLICYYSLGFIVYKTIFILTKSTEQSLLGVIAYFMCQPFAIYSLFYLADTVGWFFGFYAIYLTIKDVQLQVILTKKVILISLIAGVGMLAKESAVVGIIYLLFVLFVMPISYKQKVKFISISTLAFLLPFIISNILTQKYYGVSVFQLIVELQQDMGFVFYNKNNIQQVFRIIDVYWLLFALGLIKFVYSLKSKVPSRHMIAFICAAPIALITMPLHPYIFDRVLFMIAPFLLVFLVMGAFSFQKYSYFVIVFGGIINISMTWIIYRFNISGILFSGLFIYTVTLIVLFFSLKAKSRTNFL